MKHIAIPLFILLVLAQSFGKWAVVLQWELNRSFIAMELCENKAKPASKCGGKCQLAKHLEQEEKHNSQRTIEKFASTTLLFSEAVADTQVFLPEELPLLHTAYYGCAPYTAPTADIFHPPAA